MDASETRPNGQPLAGLPRPEVQASYDRLKAEERRRDRRRAEENPHASAPPEVQEVRASEILCFWEDRPPLPKFEYSIDGFAFPGALIALGGRSESGTTTNMTGLAYAGINGLPWLGRVVKQTRVIYSAPDMPAHLFERAVSALPGEIPKSSLIINRYDARATRTQIVDAIAAYAEEAMPGLILLDSLALHTGLADWNDYGPCVNALRPFRELAEAYETAIIFRHHGTKGGDPLTGSEGLKASIDNALHFKSGADGFTVESCKCRYGDRFGKAWLSLDHTTGLVVAGEPPQAGDDPIKAAIRDYLGPLEGAPVGYKLIAEKIRKRPTDTNAALFEMAEAGEVTQFGKRNGRGDNALRFAIVPVPP